MGKLAFFISSLAFALAAAGVAPVASCGAKGGASKRVTSEDRAKLEKGVWGGEHIRLEVTDDGAQVEYDCAHSTITQSIAPDRDGKFDVRGDFVPERGGPVRRDEPPPTRPARYAGRVSGDTLTLSVTLTDTGEHAGDFTLTRGSSGRVMKCR
ncbi:MAG: hypothetical protein LC746_02820 [Acidobacteria bacterium]|nr:hypothetical protein [Acidobacteriota bacterium]